MNKTIVILSLMVCLGCQSAKQTPATSNHSSTDEVIVTVSKINSSYKMEAKWIKYDSDGAEDVIAAPSVTGKPNCWAAVAAVEIPKDYASSTKFMLDGELIKTSGGFGTTLKTLITPTGDKVQAKGVFAANKAKARFEVPFCGVFELDEPTIIYERKEYFGSDAYTNIVEEVGHSGTKLF